MSKKINADNELTPQVVFILRRAKGGVKLPEAEEAMADFQRLVHNGWIKLKKNLWGRLVYKLTPEGKRQLLRARHSTNLLIKEIAAGFCDHLSLSMFESLIQTQGLERYIEAQRNLQRLILLHHFWNR